MTDDLDFYDLLGVSEDASQEEIRKGFRQQVRKYHPDLNDDPRAPAQFTALKKAYDTLADSQERDAYDRLGHDEYVRKRISGLPSPSDWQIPEGEEFETEFDGPVGSQSRATATGDSGSKSKDGGPGASSTRTKRSDASGASEDATSDRGSRTGRDTASTGTSGSSDFSAGGGTSTGQNTFSEFSDTAEDAGGSFSPSKKDSVRAGVGTARNPDNVWTADEDEAEESEPAEESRLGNWDSERLTEGVRRRVRSAMGWPLIIGADLLFVAGLLLYGLGNVDGLKRLFGALQSAGGDPVSLFSVLGSRYQIDTLPEFIGSGLSQSFPISGIVVVSGMAFLPSVYFFLVRWTRENRIPWQPSYLYVAGALSPTFGLLVSLLSNPPGLYVEAVFYVLIPSVTIVAMLFFGQLKPRMERFVRKWRYRFSN